jgi:hypothetical protein
MKRSPNFCHPRVNWRSLRLKKFALLIGLGVMGLTLGTGGAALGITLDFSTTTGGYLYFVGGTSPYFEFINNSSGNSFKITGVHDGAGGNSLGLLGNISGMFDIGEVQVFAFPPNPTIYFAAVTNPGLLTIKDGAGIDFTATVQWNAIRTVGTGGGINYNAFANLSDIQYGGDISDFKDWVAEQTAVVGFTTAKTLVELTAQGADNSTAFNGTLSAVPVPASVFLLGTGLAGLVGLGYGRRIKA